MPDDASTRSASSRARSRDEYRNIKLTIEYDGTNYVGWQIQKGKKTIQGLITRAIKRVTGEKVSLTGASRTDAGVHAEGQVANFKTKSRIPLERIPHALNAYLLQDISIRSAELVTDSFHAQFDAVSKTYRYIVLNSYIRRPIFLNRCYLVRGRLNLQKMQHAARFFIGKKDFRAFGTDSGRLKNTVRKVNFFRVTRDGEFIHFLVNANGFLYNMVRCMVGTLIKVGADKIEPQDVKSTIENNDRRKAGPIVPACGLYLIEVKYD